MTREEFLDKYGDVVVQFSYYYKYTFHYKGKTHDGNLISVGYGGCSDDIYRCEVHNNESMTIEALYPNEGTVLNSEGKELESFYDY